VTPRRPGWRSRDGAATDPGEGALGQAQDQAGARSRAAGNRGRVATRAVAPEAHLAGKFLLRRSDPTLTAAEIALGYNSCCRLSAGGET